MAGSESTPAPSTVLHAWLSLLQRDRKYEDGRKLKKKDSQGSFAYDVQVVSAEYDSANHRWNYTLNDHRGDPIPGTTKETDLTA
ncbi:MAG: hypothetical protein Q9183_003075 [Haloplaca sp. 2 TL-2023]